MCFQHDRLSFHSLYLFQDCQAAVSYYGLSTTHYAIEIVATANPSDYVASAFSFDTAMVGSSATACLVSEASGDRRVDMYYTTNRPNGRTALRLPDPGFGLSDVFVAYADGKMICRLASNIRLIIHMKP